MFSTVPWRQEQGKGKKIGLWCSHACFNQVVPYFLHFRVQINLKFFFIGVYLGCPSDSDGIESASNAGNLCSISASGRSPGE